MMTRHYIVADLQKARRGLLLVFLLSCLFSSEPARAQQVLPDALQEVFRSGVEAQKAGRLDEAEKTFLRVLREGGKAAFVYNNLGIIYQQRGDHPRAIAQFREAVRLQPDYAAPHILLGTSLLATGKIPEATHELERGVKLQPREPLAHLELARAYEKAGNLSGVVSQYRNLCELAPEEPEYAYRLGTAYLKLAERSFQEIQRINPRSARVYQSWGENYRGRGQLDLAVRTFERAAQADPKLPGIHLALAQIYLEQGKPADARQEIEQELAIVPESVAALELKRNLETAGPQPR
jgi:tetratricopeptide (TPR) repeat protein